MALGNGKSKSKGKGNLGEQATLAADSPENTIKQLLMQSLQKSEGRALTAGEVVYECEGDVKDGYIAVCRSGLLRAEYQGAVLSSSKKMAEHEAARQALAAEFPEVIKQT